MTLQGAVRYDNAWSYSPPQTIGPALINGQTFLGHAAAVRPDGGRRTSRTFTARRSCARRLRQRKDGRQGQRRQVHGSGEQPERQLLDLQSDRPDRHDRGPDVDRQRHRRAGNRHGDFIPQCDLTNNAANGECAATTATTFGTDQRTTAGIDPGCWSGGACVRETGSSACRFSSSCCPACRWRSAT